MHSPPPSPYPPASLATLRQPSNPPATSPLPGGCSTSRCGEWVSMAAPLAGERSDTARLPHCPQPAGSLHPVTSRLLDLYHECVDSSGWARVLYDIRGGMEKLTIFCKIPPPPPPTVADPPSCKPGRQGRRREAWAPGEEERCLGQE